MCKRPHAFRQVGCGIGCHCRSINGHDRHIAEDQQHTQRCRQKPPAKGDPQKTIGAARPRIAKRQSDIGKSGRKRDHAADQEGDGCPTPRTLDCQAEGCEVATTDDAADPDRERAQDADRTFWRAVSVIFYLRDDPVLDRPMRDAASGWLWAAETTR